MNIGESMDNLNKLCEYHKYLQNGKDVPMSFKEWCDWTENRSTYGDKLLTAWNQSSKGVL